MDLLGLGVDYESEKCHQVLGQALLRMCDQRGPILIHCTQGKDRTGFFAILIQALADTDLNTITAAFMQPYQDYYGVTKEGTPEKYETIKAYMGDPMLLCLSGCDDIQSITQENLKDGAKKYLKDGGLSDEEIQRIEDYLTN